MYILMYQTYTFLYYKTMEIYEICWLVIQNDVNIYIYNRLIKKRTHLSYQRPFTVPDLRSRTNQQVFPADVTHGWKTSSVILCHHMGVSWNRGTPTSSTLINGISWDFPLSTISFGVLYPTCGTPHVAGLKWCTMTQYDTMTNNYWTGICRINKHPPAGPLPPGRWKIQRCSSDSISLHFPFLSPTTKRQILKWPM